MSKKVKNKIMEDFNKTYSIKIDREKIYNSIPIKENTEDSFQTVLYLKRLCRRISLIASVIIICLIGVIGYIAIETHYGDENNIVTDEFEEYMNQYSSKGKSILYSQIQLDTDVNIYFYKLTNIEKNKEYYFYIFNDKFKLKTYNLTFNNNIIALNNKSYGLLCEFIVDDPNKDISFTIESNNIIKQYKIG